MRADGLLNRFSAIGAAAQATVPGLYAWGVTVAPGAWARGASWPAKAAAVGGLLMLAGGVLGERRWGGRARAASFWGFVAACAASWCAAPSALGPGVMDATRGLAGVLGWALFGVASAAPALAGSNRAERGAEHPPSPPRAGAADTAYLLGAAVLAALPQAIGWNVAPTERALLVRFVALVAGLAVIGATAEMALQRHTPRSTPSRPSALRRAGPALVALAILALAGLLNVALD